VVPVLLVENLGERASLAVALATVMGDCHFAAIEGFDLSCQESAVSQPFGAPSTSHDEILVEEEEEERSKSSVVAGGRTNELEQVR